MDRLRRRLKEREQDGEVWSDARYALAVEVTGPRMGVASGWEAAILTNPNNGTVTMADESASLSILANHVATKRRNVLYGTALAEVSAIALDLSAMMAQIVPALELIAGIPEVERSANGAALRSTLSRLKTRFEAHAEAMAELNRAR